MTTPFSMQKVIGAVLFCGSFILSFNGYGADPGIFHEVLQKVSETSLAMESAEYSGQANQLLLESELTQYDLSAFFRAGYSDQQIVPTSPFTPTHSLTNDFEMGASKLWASGFQTDLTYLYTDQRTYFPTRSDFLYKSPVLQLSVTSRIMKDLFYKRHWHFINYTRLSRDFEKLNSKIEKKKVLAQSLVDLSQILEQKQNIQVQEDICQSTKKQANNLQVKRKRGSVSQREFLLGQKELTSCLAVVSSLSELLTESIENFNANYSLKFSELKVQDIEKIFDSARSAYERLEAQNKTMDFHEQDEIKAKDLAVEALKSKQSQLEAETNNSLSMELRTGLSGIGSNFSQSNEVMGQADYPFLYVGLRVDLPLKNRKSEKLAASNFYQLKAGEKQRELVLNQKRHRLKTLRQTLKSDFNIYEKYQHTVELSHSILKEARRDFSNGRINFNDLVEFNKQLSDEQRTLASHRINLIVKMVEFLDFYNYFDPYLSENS